MIDLHRHDEYSTFDGYGKASELAKIAKDLGYTSLGLSNHGNTNGLVKHYDACKSQGIKPVLGVESYFLPVPKEQTRGYHICFFAKDAKGYENINTMQYLGEEFKYYNSIVTLDIIRNHAEGVICTTACIASYFGQAIKAGKKHLAEKMLVEFQKIFGDDLYIEIQPYKVSEVGLQEYVNEELIALGRKLHIKCILTSDSHRGAKDDFPTYMKMHEIANHNGMDIEGTYKERYMPSQKEIMQRFVKMHSKTYGKDRAIQMAKGMIRNLEEIEDKVDADILDSLEENLPVFREGINSQQLLKDLVKEGLKEKGKFNKKYISRVKEELEVIHYHGFEDYFLMVRDYCLWAKEHGIGVGPGRGSACNCCVSYAVGITDVDPIKFNLDYHRFIRKDKKKMPDIDLDFATNRREEVIEYLLKRYEGKSAQIISYGLYKTDNVINDLAKVCGLPTSGDITDEEKKRNKETIKELKSYLNGYVDDQMGVVKVDELLADPRTTEYNKMYDDICIHFYKLYRKVRFMGTHAAGVAIVGTDLLKYTSMRVDAKTGKKFISYDLVDAERIKIIKFDILGLKTMESLTDLRELTGVRPNYDEILEDEEVMERFRNADTDGVFQFESSSAKEILKTIHPDNFDDLCAGSSMNRPGPLSMKMHETYAASKAEAERGMIDFNGPYTKYLAETYGTLVYQEQVQAIATNVGGMKWEDADKIIKLGSGGAKTTAAIQYKAKLKEYEEEFAANAKKFGIDRKEAGHLFNEFFNYSFNKGHGTGYTLISIEEMWNKVHYPTFFWFVKLRDTNKDDQIAKFLQCAVKDEIVIFLPHVNYTAGYSVRKIDGEYIIQQGLSSITGVGEKAAQFIEVERRENGIFRNYDDFYDRCKSRTVTSKVIRLLQESGALEFNKKTYIKRVTAFNTSLYMKAMS